MLAPGPRRNGLEKWLETDLKARFESRILPVDENTAELWGAMAGSGQNKGVVLAVIDGLVAATAIHNDLVVVTRNVKDFAIWAVPVVNPWEP